MDLKGQREGLLSLYPHWPCHHRRADNDLETTRVSRGPLRPAYSPDYFCATSFDIEGIRPTGLDGRLCDGPLFGGCIRPVYDRLFVDIPVGAGRVKLFQRAGNSLSIRLDCPVRAGAKSRIFGFHGAPVERVALAECSDLACTGTNRTCGRDGSRCSFTVGNHAPQSRSPGGKEPGKSRQNLGKR